MADDVSSVILKGDPNALIKAFDAGAARAKKFDGEMKSITGSISSLGSHWRGLLAAFGASISVAGLINIGKSALEAMDNIDKLSQKVGVGAEMLQVFGYQAKISGLGEDALAVSLGRLSKNMLEAAAGGGTAVDAFKALGLSVKDVSGNIKSSDQMLIEIADKFSTMQDGVGKTGLAIQLFGRSGKEMIPFLNQGKEGIAAVRQEMERLGILMDEKTIKYAGQVKDQFEKLSMTAKGLAVNVMAELLPALDNGSKALLDITANKELVRDWANNIATGLKGIASWAIGTAAAFDILGTVMGEAAARAAKAWNESGLLARATGWQHLKTAGALFFGGIGDDKSAVERKILGYGDLISGLWDKVNNAAAGSGGTGAGKKSPFGMVLTSDQQKAIDEWGKKMIGVRAEIEKNQYDMDDYFKSLIDIQKKYDEMMADAQRTMKEKNVRLDLSPVEQLKQVSELKALQDFRKRIDDEINKEVLKSAQDRAAIILDNETYINTRLKQDWENRVEEEKRTAGLQHANLTKILILGKISQEDYWKNIEALERASGKRQQDIIDEKNRNILEAETSHRIAMLNAAEKNMDIPQYQAIAGRAAAYQTLIQSYAADLQKANESGDKLTALNLQGKIDEINAKLIEENLLLQEQTGIFSEGLIRGVKEYAYTMKSSFQYGRDLVKDTASSMKDSFKGAFADIREGTFDLSDALKNMCDRIAANYEDMLSEMLTNWILTGNAMKSASSGNSIGGLGGLISSLFGSGAGGNISDYPTDWAGYIGSAKGNIFATPGLKPFLNTVVSKPTIFQFARGVGLMGEGGNEAIMPLARTSSGDLGVRATGAMNVEIILNNNTGIPLKATQGQSRLDGRKMVKEIMIDLADKDSTIRNLYGVK